jgi:hypothetical protein
LDDAEMSKTDFDSFVNVFKELIKKNITPDFTLESKEPELLNLGTIGSNVITFEIIVTIQKVE